MLSALRAPAFSAAVSGFIMARSMRSRLNVDVSAQRSSLASSLVATWSVRVRIRKPQISSPREGVSRSMRPSWMISNLMAIPATSTEVLMP